MRSAVCLVVLAASAVLGLGACEKKSVDITEPAPIVASRLSLTSHPAYGVLYSGSSVQITARLQDSFGSNATGTRVAFTTTGGTLEPAAALIGSAGLVTVTLQAGEPVTVTATADTLSTTLDVGAVAPYALRISGPAVATLTDWNGTVSVEPNRNVISPPSAHTLTFTCGIGDPRTQAPGVPLWSQRCSYSTAGEYVLTATAIAANGWSTSVTTRTTMQVAPPPPPPPPAPPAPLPGATFTALELNRTATSATWRFFASAINGSFSGDLVWNFDYTTDPSAPGATQTIRTRPSSDHEEDVVYTSNGLRQIRLTTQVGGVAVTSMQTITVAFP